MGPVTISKHTLLHPLWTSLLILLSACATLPSEAILLPDEILIQTSVRPRPLRFSS
ncbi:MAG: hypothetical protein HC806_08555, partial [Anaerolineae bacterium]|nr:hypothetical protein [Anaerolineae bacterium]